MSLLFLYVIASLVSHEQESPVCFIILKCVLEKYVGERTACHLSECVKHTGMKKGPEEKWNLVSEDISELSLGTLLSLHP